MNREYNNESNYTKLLKIVTQFTQNRHNVMHSETDVHKFQWPELATIPKPVNKVCMHACTITNSHAQLSNVSPGG